MATITAPDAAALTGVHVTYYGPLEVTFRDGVAEVDELPDGIRRYMLSAGYKIDDEQYTPDPSTTPVRLAEAGLDARDAGAAVQVGTPGQDGAVSPDGAFLAPVNAGQADPHGPEVVAPGIHAEGERVVRSGPVSPDPTMQSAAEQRFAEELLVEQEPVEPPVAAGDFIAEGGPLGLSDPGSAQIGEDQAGEGASGDAAVAGTEPKGNASLRAWQSWAREQGATPEQIEGKSRDDLRVEYGS